MIEVVSASRCTLCDICVKVCPTNVFDTGPDGVPVIARQSDCQTCFVCELNCPADAMFVSPFRDAVAADSTYRDEEWLADNGHFGKYREMEGWGPGRTPQASLFDSMLFLQRIQLMVGGRGGSRVPAADEHAR